MATLVLAGSHVWRRTSLESCLPRPLLPVAGRPLIAHSLSWLAEGGLSDATIRANGTACLIKTHLERVAGLPSLSFVDDEMPRGPAGCAADTLRSCDAEHLLLVEGTAIPALDLSRLLHEHRASGALVTIVVQPCTPERPDARERVVPVGVYVFERRALAEVSPFGYHDIKEMLLQRLHRAGDRLRTHEAEGWCHRIVDARTYLNANHAVISGLSDDQQSAAWLASAPADRLSHAHVVAHPTSRIDPGALLVGPILAGPRCVVMPGAVVIGPAAIGAGTTIQSGAVVSRSILWDRCVIGRDALVDQSVVVHDMHVLAGAQIVEAVGYQSAAGLKRHPDPPAPQRIWRDTRVTNASQQLVALPED